MCCLKLTQEARHRCAERAQATVDDYVSGRASGRIHNTKNQIVFRRFGFSLLYITSYRTDGRPHLRGREECSRAR